MKERKSNVAPTRLQGPATVDRQFHPIADAFPLLQEKEFDALFDDIRDHGLLEPIWVHRDGRIIDGRNRYRACIQANVQARYRTFEGDDAELVPFVVSLNLRRRHLTESQRTMVAASLANRSLGENQFSREGLQICEPSVSQADAAKLLNVSPRGVASASAIKRRGATSVVSAVRSGELVVSAATELIILPKKDQPKALELAREVAGGKKVTAKVAAAASEAVRTGKMDVHFSSKDEEWYTPRHIVEAVERVLGLIDLDPCSNDRDNPNVPARRHFTKEDDGLRQEWHGRVFLNPPYGRGIAEWTSKLKSEFDEGGVSEAIALLPARTDTRWFQELGGHPKCFLRGRLNFSEHENAAPFPSAAVYFGNNPQGFANGFGPLGDVSISATSAGLEEIACASNEELAFALLRADPVTALKVLEGRKSLDQVQRERKKAAKRAALEDIAVQQAKAAEGVYDVLVIDPPWPMKKIERDVRPNQVELDYPTMREDELAELELPMADDCHVWVWTTHKFLPMALRLVEKWGLKYVCPFTWCKPGGFQPIGLPQYASETAIYARRGAPEFVDTRNFKTWFEAPRGAHSEKPEGFYQLVRRVTGGRRLDMFNRRSIEGFDGWGKEAVQ